MKDIPYIADAVEFRAWAKQAPYTFNALEDDLKAAIDEEDYSENLPQNVMDEIQTRGLILSDKYPFECDGYKVEARGAETRNSTYVFCLGLSLLPDVFIVNDQRARQFETIAMRAAVGFFGGQGLRIGAPWRTEEIATYDVLLDQVVGLIPDLGERVRDVAPGGGDGGWDVLVVKDFADKRFPRLVALGNCATGRTDWKRKGKETEPDYFWEFFAHGHRSTFVTFFAVPFVMDDDARKRKLSSTGMTFDRFRICEYAPQSALDVSDWVESVRAAALEVPFN
jgi:hypothetical protein